MVVVVAVVVPMVVVVVVLAVVVIVVSSQCDRLACMKSVHKMTGWHVGNPLAR